MIRPYVSAFWVAGKRQFQFARKLGFRSHEIITGLYAADVDQFKMIKDESPDPFLIYVGRFEAVKGVDLLYKVFTELSDEDRNGWTLKMVGNGKLKNQLLPTNNIIIHDFMQPAQLISFASKAGGFILPSTYEPWGVVVQEFAAAGKPLILSTAVNSGEQFLVDGENGYLFKNGNYQDLKSALIKFFHTSHTERRRMGEKSSELGMKGSPQNWVNQLLSIYRKEVPLVEKTA